MTFSIARPNQSKMFKYSIMTAVTCLLLRQNILRICWMKHKVCKKQDMNYDFSPTGMLIWLGAWVCCIGICALFGSTVTDMDCMYITKSHYYTHDQYYRPRVQCTSCYIRGAAQFSIRSAGEHSIAFIQIYFNEQFYLNF